MIDDVVVSDSSTSTNRINSSNTMPSNPFIGQVFLLMTPDGAHPPGMYVYNGNIWESATNTQVISHINVGQGFIGGGQGSDGAVDLHLDTNFVATVSITNELQSTKLDRSGDSMNGSIDMNQNHINNIPSPLENHQVTNKQYTDERALIEANKRVLKNGDEMFGPLSMNGNIVTGLPAPINNSDAVNRNYVDSIDLGVMSVSTNNTGLQITDVDGHVTVNIDYNVVAQKSTTDNLHSIKLNRAGDTMSGNLNMGSNRIVNIEDPVSDSDASSKVYVDQSIQDNSVYSYEITEIDQHGELFVVLDEDKQTARNIKKHHINISGFNNDANFTSPNIDEPINYLPTSGEIITLDGVTQSLLSYNTYESIVSIHDNVVMTSPQDLLLSNIPNLDAAFGSQTTTDSSVSVVSRGPIRLFAQRTSSSDIADVVTINRDGVHIGSNQLWGSHNHGTSSGLDADLVRGISGGDYVTVRSQDTHSIQSTISFTGQTTFGSIPVFNGTDVSADTNIIQRLGNTWNLQLTTDDTNPNDLLHTIEYRTVDGNGVYRFDSTGAISFEDLNTSDTIVFWSSKSDGVGSGLDADMLGGQSYTDYLRSDINQTMIGRLTLSHAPSNNFHAATKKYVDDADTLKLNKSGDTMSGVLNMGNNLITNLPTPSGNSDAANKSYADTKLSQSGGTMTGALVLHQDPTSDYHAATKRYVDNAAAGLDLKESVLVTTTENITLSGTQTIDGVLVAVGDRVLVKDQTNRIENGIYDVASGAWSRSDDAGGDPAVAIQTGMFTFVREGVEFKGTGWILTTKDPVIDTTELYFTQFSESTSYSGGTGINVQNETISFDEAYGDGRYLGISSTAANASQLGGQDPSYYVNVSSDQEIDGEKTFSKPITVNGNITAHNLETFRLTASNTTAEPFEVIFVNTSSNSVTINLPNSPSIGDQVTIMDLAGTFASNNCIVARNGSTIMSLAENMTISNNNASATMIYSGNTTHGWRLRY